MFSCLACADAYLTPHIKRYVQGFSSGFQNQLEVSNLENIHMFKVNNRNTRKKCGICSKLTTKAPEDVGLQQRLKQALVIVFLYKNFVK